MAQLRFKTPQIGDADRVGKSFEHQLVVARIANKYPARHFGVQISAQQFANNPARARQLVVVAKPAVDVDAADRGLQALAFHERHDGRDLRLTQMRKLAVINRDVGFPPRRIGGSVYPRQFALDLLQHALHAAKVAGAGRPILLLHF